jgi:hypothetical protein
MKTQFRNIVRLAFLFLMVIVFSRTTLTSAILTLQEPRISTTAITYGTTTIGSIGAPSENDSFTFSAESGDVILIGISKVTGDLWPRIRLYDPNGTLIADEEDPNHTEIYREIQTPPDEFKLFLPFIIGYSAGRLNESSIHNFEQPRIITTSGIYTILVSDGFNGSYTGSYNLYLQKLNPPAGATPVSYGQISVSSIGLAAEMDGFTFQVNEGERFIIGITNVSGDIWPEIRLFNQDGIPLSVQGGPNHSEIEYSAISTGAYSILVADGFRGTYTGSYNLFIQRLDDPVGATSIGFGETKSGTIGLAAEMDPFTFNATANDQVQITIAKVSGDIWPEIRLYDPNGFQLNEQGGPSGGEITQILPATGQYSVLVSDGFRGEYTGSYNVHIEKLP